MRNKYSEACRKIQFKIFLFTSRLSYVNRFEKKGLLFLGQNKTLSTRFKHLKNVGVKSRAMFHDYLYSLHACQISWLKRVIQHRSLDFASYM